MSLFLPCHAISCISKHLPKDWERLWTLLSLSPWTTPSILMVVFVGYFSRTSFSSKYCSEDCENFVKTSGQVHLWCAHISLCSFCTRYSGTAQKWPNPHPIYRSISIFNSPSLPMGSPSLRNQVHNHAPDYPEVLSLSSLSPLVST